MGVAGGWISVAPTRPHDLVVELDGTGRVRAVRGGTEVGGDTAALELVSLIHPDDRDRALAMARVLRTVPAGVRGEAALRMRVGGDWRPARARFHRHRDGTTVEIRAGRRAGGVPGDEPAGGHGDAAALAASPVPVAVLDADGSFVEASRAMCALLGYERAELLRRSAPAIVHPADRATGDALTALVAAGARRASAPVRWLRADGIVVDVMAHVTGDGLTIVHLEELDAPAARAAPAAGTFEAAAALLVAVDGEARVVLANAAALGAGALAPGEVTGRPVDELFPPADGDARLGTLVARVLSLRSAVGEDVRIAAPDGGVCVVAWTATPAPDSTPGVSVVLSGIDVTEREATLADLSHRALHDPLTRLPNRVLFYERLRHALTRLERRDHELAVLFLDLNHFKEVNDRFGHDAGDRLLVALAERFRAAVRPSDTVARMGGDEFVVLCEDLPDADTAITIADRLIDAVEGAFAVDGEDVHISAAIGLAFARHAGEDADSIVRQADAAMYEAKGDGSTRTRTADAVVAIAPSGSIDAASLRDAIDAGGVVVLYQPQIELPAGQLVGVEALVRIRHPDLGLLAPAAFMPVAEESGLIERIGAEVVRQVTHRLAGWRGLAPDLRVTINLSARELKGPDPATRFEAALRDAGVDPEAIVVDVREDVLLGNDPDAVRALRDLKALGVRLSVDDAGIRFTASELVRDLGIDEVKVGGEHVRRLGGEIGSSAVVASIVRLARALDLRTVAQGVETEDQLAALRSLGCEAGQGYLFAGPQPADVIDRLLGPDLRWPTDVAVG